MNGQLAGIVAGSVSTLVFVGFALALCALSQRHAERDKGEVECSQGVAGARDADTFGKRMRDAREHAGISERDAAERGGLTLASLRRIERSQTKMVQTEIRLRILAKMYGVPEVWLYAGDVAGKATTLSWYRIEAA